MLLEFASFLKLRSQTWTYCTCILVLSTLNPSKCNPSKSPLSYHITVSSLSATLYCVVHFFLSLAARVDALFKHKKLILETINEIPDLERAAGDLDRDKDVTEVCVCVWKTLLIEQISLRFSVDVSGCLRAPWAALCLRYVTCKSPECEGEKITPVTSHPGKILFQKLPTGRRFRSMITKTAQHRNNFFPLAVSLVRTVTGLQFHYMIKYMGR